MTAGRGIEEEKMSVPERFATGDTVPESGIYQVTHKDHRLPHEVTLLAGQIFPRCSKCNDRVFFEAVRYAQQIHEGRDSFKVVVYELPVLDEEN